MMKYLFIVFSLFGALFVANGCSSGSESGNQNKIEEIKFHTQSQEGRWKGKAEDHTPVIKKLTEETFEVTVPLKKEGNQRHYIEVIVFMEGKRIQLAEKKFTPLDQNFRAVFSYPKNPKPNTDYYVVAKCNLHQMWLAPVPDWRTPER